MGIFDRLFGRKPDLPPPDPVPPAPDSAPPTPKPVPPTPASPAPDPDLIRLFDPYGREMFVTREKWRTDILPGALRSAWSDPGRLYGVVMGAVEDGCAADVVDAAEHLHRTDPVAARGTCAYGIVLMKNGRLDEAERVFMEHLGRHGEEGIVLTNLAKVYAGRSDAHGAEDTLWRALRADPNQDDAVQWYAAMSRDRSGEEGMQDALRRIAALPGSWRAQLWLARAALGAGDRDGALALYRQTLSRLGEQVPADALLQISGDLGNHGLPAEVARLVEPWFRAEVHGVRVGDNLMRARLQMGDAEAARAVLDRLHAVRRPDWREALQFWDAEVARAAVEGPVAAPLQMSLLSLEGPVWLAPDSLAVGLFRWSRGDGPVIAFLGGTADNGSELRQPRRELADDAGRLSRALPLFLAEQAELRGGARARTLVPWIAGEPGGFALAARPWSDEDAARYGRDGAPPADYVVTSHLQCAEEPWTAEVRLLRAADGACLDTLAASFASADHRGAVRELGERLMETLAGHAGVRRAAPSSVYELPDGPGFASYVLRLEQLLAVRCSAMQGGAPGTLNGEREILDGNLRLCLDHPHSLTTRVLLAQTVSAMRKARPAAVDEFRERIEMLQQQKPLPEPAQGLVRMILDEAEPA